jgi:hypothetical protein
MQDGPPKYGCCGRSMGYKPPPGYAPVKCHSCARRERKEWEWRRSWHCCETCCRWFQRTNNKAQFCSSACRLYLRETKLRAKRPTWKTEPSGTRSCAACGYRFNVGKPGRIYCDDCTGGLCRSASRLSAAPCSVCCKPFIHSGLVHRCGDCAFRLNRSKNKRKNKRRSSAPRGERYVLADLIAAAEGICHLCAQPVDLSASGLNPFGPTIDHLVPLSLGGIDCRSNVALAHRICNTRRGNRRLVAA